MKNLLPFDTSIYDDLPVAIFIYQAVLNSEKIICDYKIIYGNKVFIAEWKKFHGNRIFLGASISAHNIFNDKVLKMIEKFSHEKPVAFSTYLHEHNAHIHLQPILNLPKFYGGFFLTNVTEYEENSSRKHFLKSIRQMQTAGVLLREKVDGSHECIFASKEFAELMECTEKEALKMMSGKGYLWTTHVDDRLSVKRMIRRKISEDGKKFLTIRKITAKDHLIWCKVYYSFIEDFGENYIYCNYFDVTSSKVYAERLRSTYMSMGNNFYRENDHTLGMFRVNLTKNKVEDLKGKDLFATDSIMRPYSEVIRLRAESYKIVEEREYFLRQMSVENLTKKYLSGQNQLSFFLLSLRKDGHFCYVNYTAALTRHPITGEIIAFISEQEANKEKVENTLLEKILAQQFDMVSYLSEGKYGVVVGDAAKIEKGNIFPITRTGKYAEYLKNQVFPVLHGDDETKKIMAESLQLDTIQKRIHEKEPYIVNIVCKIDDEIYYKRFDFFTADPRSNFFILLKSDTTEIQRKQIEQNNQLREALAESRQANGAKTAFLSRISHEIRTPMNAIIGYVELSKKLHKLCEVCEREHCPDDVPKKLYDFILKIESSSKHLLDLINDILDMGRIERGQTTLRNVEFSFKDFLEQMDALAQNQCREKNLTFTSTFSGPIKNYYIGDEMKLRQILVNILSNAIKFTEPNGKISLSVECTAQFEGNSTLKFVVKDTGIGIKKDYLPKIFDPFSQEDGTNTSKYGGSGLGLAITKNIVDMMNGTVSVDSEKGKGATFIVTLPLKNSEKAEEFINNSPSQTEENFEPVTLEGKKVLLVEDMAVNAELMKMILEMQGVTAEHAENGKIAVDMFKEKPPGYYSAILMDIRMPVMDGLKATETIRALDRKDAKTVPILAMTANAFDEDVQRSLQAGMNAHLAKPVDTEVLFQSLKDFITRS